MELKKINMDRIILQKSQKYSEGEVFTLAKSIALAGLLSPVTVAPIAHTDRYELVTGVKRFYACRLLGFKDISAIVIKANASFAKTTLNKGSYNHFFEEADAIEETLTKTGLTSEELSNLSAYTADEIIMYHQISSLTELEREIIKSNYITKEIAFEISKVEDLLKRNGIIGEIAKKRLNYSEAVRLIDKGLPTPKKYRAHRTIKFRDLSLFDNTINRAIEILKEAGVDAQINTQKRAGATEYKIKINT